jgi:hypothetical protein
MKIRKNQELKLCLNLSSNSFLVWKTPASSQPMLCSLCTDQPVPESVLRLMSSSVPNTSEASGRNSHVFGCAVQRISTDDMVVRN